MTEEEWTGAEITRAIKRLEETVASIDAKLDSDRFVTRLEYDQRRNINDREFGKVWTAIESHKKETEKMDAKMQATLEKMQPPRVSFWQILAAIVPWLAFIYLVSTDYFPLIAK